MGAADKYKEWQERQKMRSDKTRANTQLFDTLITKSLMESARNSDRPIQPPNTNDRMHRAPFVPEAQGLRTYLRPEGQQLRQGAPEPAGARRPVSEANPLALLLAIMGDPRNSWMGGPGKIVHGAEALPALVAGLGPLFKRDEGWRVLKEYMSKGGTPKTLRDILRKRGYDEEATNIIASHAHQGTDIAAPAPRPGMTYTPEHVATANQRAEHLRQRYPEETFAPQHIPLDQIMPLHHAEDMMHRYQPGKRTSPEPVFRTAGDLSKSREQLVEAGHEFGGETVPMIPAGNQGQAAYAAIASRMARLMDDPNFLSLKQHYLPPPVSDAEYYKALPIENQAQHEFYRGIPFRDDFQVSPVTAEHAIYAPGGLVDQAITAGEAGDHATANRIMNAVTQRNQSLGRPNLSPPRTFRAAEDQRTTDLNRRTDQRQGGQP